MFGVFKKFSSNSDETLDIGELRRRRSSNQSISNSFTNGQSKVGMMDLEEMGFMLYDIWCKNVEDLPIGKDLPRLARKTRIYDDQSGDIINFIEENNNVMEDDLTISAKDDGGDGKEKKPMQETNVNYTVIDKQNDQNEIMRAVFSVLTTLANELGEHVGTTTGYSIAGMSLELFDREVNISDHASLSSFILRCFGEHGRVTRVLKACNQSILAAPVTQLKRALMSHVEYKDQKGGWTIHIRIGIDGSVSVIHRKMEQVLRKGKDLMYQQVYRFEWSLNLNFQLSSGGIQKLDLISFSLEFMDMYFDQSKVSMTEQERLHARKVLEDLFKDVHVEFNEKFLSRTNEWRKRKRNSN